MYYIQLHADKRTWLYVQKKIKQTQKFMSLGMGCNPDGHVAAIEHNELGLEEDITVYAQARVG
jgi:6-phosphogluconolactonase/glucosamine-6-phosphate isomerase/deaminase